MLRRRGLRRGRVRRLGSPVPEPQQLRVLGQVPPDGGRVGGHRERALRRHRVLRAPDQRAAAGGAATMSARLVVNFA